MNAGIGVPNAMWWVQAKLTGGAGRITLYGFVWLLLVVLASAAARYSLRDEPPTFAVEIILNVLAGTQLVLLILWACNSIFRAMVRDIDSSMLESHRLSPMSASAVVLGYMVGPFLPVLIFFAINVVAGLVLLRSVGISPVDWLAGNGFLLALAPLTWTVTVLLGIGRRKPFNPLLALFLIGSFGAPLFIIPGLGIFSGAFAAIVAGSYLFRAPFIEPAPEIALIGIALIMTVIWFRAAMRKFDRPDLPAFGVWRAFGLLLIWLVFAAAPLLFVSYADKATLAAMGGAVRDFAEHGFIANSLAATMDASVVMALFPMGAVAFSRVRAVDGRAHGRAVRTWLTGSGPALAAALVLCLAAVDRRGVPAQTLFLTWTAIAASLVTVESAIVLRGLNNKPAVRLVVMIVLFLWAAPLLTDLWYREYQQAVSEMRRELPATVISGFSPFGSVWELFSRDGAPLIPGVVAQVGFALIYAALAHRALRRRAAGAAPAVPPPPAPSSP